jgi:hypothetical protein
MAHRVPAQHYRTVFTCSVVPTRQFILCVVVRSVRYASAFAYLRARDFFDFSIDRELM